VCTDGRQSQNFMNINEDRLVEINLHTAYFVASLLTLRYGYNCQN